MRLAARLLLPDHSNSTTLYQNTSRNSFKKMIEKANTSRKTIIKKGAGHYTSFFLSSLSLPLSNATCTTLILSSSDYQFLRIALHFFIFKTGTNPCPPSKSAYWIGKSLHTTITHHINFRPIPGIVAFFLLPKSIIDHSLLHILR